MADKNYSAVKVGARRVLSFPEQLRRSIAREALGQAIYEQRAVWSQVEVPSWRSLSYEIAERYREEADEVLDRVEVRPSRMPPIVITGLRGTGAPVIGAIQPSKGGA